MKYNNIHFKNEMKYVKHLKMKYTKSTFKRKYDRSALNMKYNFKNLNMRYNKQFKNKIQ